MVAGMAEPLFLTCDASAVDVTTQQCSAPVWVPQPQLFPSLSLVDGGLFGFAILTVWCAAYMARALRVHG